jgi:hypothetical protein
MTIGGEIDGLTRISRVSISYGQYLQIASNTTPEYANTIRPVIILPEVVHSHFCGGHLVTGDVNPTISSLSFAEATQNIATPASFFLQSILFNNSVDQSLNSNEFNY